MSGRPDRLIGFAMCMLLFGCDSGTKSRPAPKKTVSGTKTAAPDVQATPDTAPPAQAKPAPVPDKPKSSPKPTPAAAGPKWEIENVVYDFGAVWAGKEVRHPFEIRNVGDQTLNIGRPKARCSCSAAESYTRQVPPDGTGVIPFLLKTTNKAGPVNEWLTIGTNDPLRPEMKIWMRGVVKTVCTPEVIADESIAAGARGAPGIESLKKRKAHFGNITTNQGLYRVIRLTNATDVPLSLELLDAPRAILKVGDQTLNIGRPKARCSCSAAESYTRQVPPDGTGVIPFLLKTTNKAGPVNEWLTIGTNDPLRPEMKIWMRGVVKTVCTPEVIADESIAAGARGAPGIESLKKRKAHFGNITTNQGLYRVIRLTNATDVPLSLELLDAPRAILKVNTKSEMIPNPFQASIEEVVPGQVFELTITGRPPFQVGTTTMGINFKTNIPDYPYYAMAATAYVPARIEVRPYKIVTNLQASTKLRIIRIVNNGTTPFKITSFATSDPTYRLRRLPTKPSERNTDKFELMLPPGNYIPPSYGEVVRFETTDAEMPIIEIPVLPDLRRPPTARPANLPIQWTPGKQ